jgi:hypothetical protein
VGTIPHQFGQAIFSPQPRDGHDTLVVLHCCRISCTYLLIQLSVSHHARVILRLCCYSCIPSSVRLISTYSSAQAASARIRTSSRAIEDAEIEVATKSKLQPKGKDVSPCRITVNRPGINDQRARQASRGSNRQLYHHQYTEVGAHLYTLQQDCMNLTVAL